ncbi:fatty acid desaturase [Ferroacidibacillus organovorans]|uniref:Fatty acid desaturase n=1 Tax=Ferroacidibacillus organovorans TaxID=1765683 RepID=A0A1V4EQC6_9BACL|nr:fatty acid desaturase [Ferroacidibacillus organovorans]
MEWYRYSAFRGTLCEQFDELPSGECEGKRKIISEEQNHWKKDLVPFQQSDLKKSLWQIVNTVAPYFMLWAAAYWSLSVSYWITLCFVILAAGFAVRMFIIFHDCCHDSFFGNRNANLIVGVFTGLMTFFPYYQWKHEHAMHHATSSNLSRRGIGDIWTLTVDEYLALSTFRKMGYRLYRNPLIMFGLGPLYLFFVVYRVNHKRAGRKERWNTYATNLGLAGIVSLLCWWLGWKSVLLIQGPILYLSGIAGIWLFYVQHQFEETYYEKEDVWNFVSAAMEGSSYYKLPKLLQWMTGNIGFHHIHHLSSRIPNYYLQQVCQRNAYMHNVSSIDLRTSLRSLRYRVWDEEKKRFVGFSDLSIRKTEKC